ncbi:uncharacterized protein LOC123510341 isoform X2 [Portunus trituberculatus]|uniref:uncharacterized protein LOC123510341 isoform X2 n=1 Tax=Portunus trituberculatus TaxID=210409 RepID=UPI001E1CFC47|nr:uncharacterized protein LOC123510341 isoform X2 [Portunus trituberculatus]
MKRPLYDGQECANRSCVNAATGVPRAVVAEGGGAVGDRGEQRVVPSGGAAVSPGGAVAAATQQAPPARPVGAATGPRGIEGGLDTVYWDG